MFGITDPWIYWAYLLVFLCVIFAIVYGIMNWNKEQKPSEVELKTDLNWEEKENQLKDIVS